MAREVVFLGLVIPTLLPVFILCIGIEWGLDTVLSRFGWYRGAWHLSLLRLAMFFSVFGILGLLIYH